MTGSRQTPRISRGAGGSARQTPTTARSGRVSNAPQNSAFSQRHRNTRNPTPGESRLSQGSGSVGTPRKSSKRSTLAMLRSSTKLDGLRALFCSGQGVDGDAAVGKHALDGDRTRDLESGVQGTAKTGAGNADLRKKASERD